MTDDTTQVPSFEELAWAFFDAVHDRAPEEEQMRLGALMLHLYPKQYQLFETMINAEAEFRERGL